MEAYATANPHLLAEEIQFYANKEKERRMKEDEEMAGLDYSRASSTPPVKSRRQAPPAGLHFSLTQMTISPIIICSSGLELCSSSVEVMMYVVVSNYLVI